MNAYKQEVYGKLIKVLANVLVLAAVAVSMYMAARHPEESAKIFSVWFFPQLLGIVTMAFLSLRCVRRFYPCDDVDGLQHASVVELPRLGRKLVRWQVVGR